MRSVWERSLSQGERVAEGRVRGTKFANIVPLIRPFEPPSPVGRRTRPQISPNNEERALIERPYSEDPSIPQNLLNDLPPSGVLHNERQPEWKSAPTVHPLKPRSSGCRDRIRRTSPLPKRWSLPPSWSGLLRVTAPLSSRSWYGTNDGS